MPTMDEWVRQFRGRSRRGPCPETLRGKAVSYARERVSGGESLARVAGELATKTVTLSRWMEEGPSRPFRAIEVVGSGEDARWRSEAGGGVVLVTRQGHRVYGLDPAALSQVLTVLG